MVREGISKLLDAQPGFKVCAAVSDRAAALQTFKQFRPCLANVDLTLQSGNGFDLIRLMTVQHPNLPVSGPDGRRRVPLRRTRSAPWSDGLHHEE